MHEFGTDLQETYEIGEIVILWESISTPFTLFVSEDGENYTAAGVYKQDPMTGTCIINLYGQSARYLKLSIPKGGFVSIYEFKVHQATEQDKLDRPEYQTKTNVAKNKTVSATTHEGAYLADYAVDGKPDTRWGSLPSGTAWLQVDLGESIHVDTIHVILESAYVPYRIEISQNGTDYTTIYQGSKDELFVTLTDLDLDARYIRLWREGENWFSIIELEVYQ